MSRGEVLKALRDAMKIFERLEVYAKADGNERGIGTLQRAKLHLQYYHNELKCATAHLYYR